MKVIKISSRTYFVRHWFRWYRVPSTGLKWERLNTKTYPQLPTRISVGVVDSNISDEELAKHIGLTK